MENGSLLSSHPSVLALNFVDESYSMSPVIPVATQESNMTSKSASRGNRGLAAGIVFLFLALGIVGFFGFRKFKNMQEDDGQIDYDDREISVDIQGVDNLKDTTRSEEDNDEEDEDASYTSNDSESSGGDGTTTDDDDTGDDGGSYSEESTDSDGVFEDDDSFDPEDVNSPGYNVYKKKKKQVKKAKNNIVINGMVDEGSVATGATGATGLHSAASQRTVKMKNVVMPSLLDVDINMR